MARGLRARTMLAVWFGALVLAAWAWLGHAAWDMSAAGMSEATITAGAAYFGWLLVMWTVMMAAMMLPSAAPMVWSFARFAAPREGNVRDPTAWFVAGYLIAWLAFSVLASSAQWGLERTASMSRMDMAMSSRTAAGGVLIIAGAYQWLPLKHACLRRCRTPIGFLMTEWRDGPSGALVMGARHGLFCVGCCWALMLVLFVAGVMNPLWIVLIALLVLAEKAAPAGTAIARASGAALVAWGGWMAGSSIAAT